MLSRAAEATETLQSERDLVAMAEDYAREAKIQVCGYRCSCPAVAAAYWHCALFTDLQEIVTCVFVLAAISCSVWSSREQCDDAHPAGPHVRG